MILTLELSPEEVNLILAGLGELQAKVSLPTILKIQQQAKEQLSSREEDLDDKDF